MTAPLDHTTLPGQDQDFTLPDGRKLRWRSYGDPSGGPVIALHGTPGSRLKFSGTAAIAGRLGLHVIAPDRWGYGGTDAHSEPSLRAFAQDIGYLADALSLRRMAVMGVSGGGPYATALAAMEPHRVCALALVSPVGPIAGVGHAMSHFHRFCFGPLTRRPRAVRAIFTGLRQLLEVSPRLGMGVAMLNVPGADRKVLKNPGVSPRLAATFREGLSRGSEGPAIDLQLFGTPWNLELGQIGTPTRLWLGSADRNVPIAAAEYLARALPDCTLVRLPGDGHLWVALHYDRVLQWMAHHLASEA